VSQTSDPLTPRENEPICLVSFEITAILLGGRPEERPSFWKMYHREHELNQKTQYDNYHVRICREQLLALKLDLKEPVYYRHGRLTNEKVVVPAARALPRPRPL
jgi:hypothetical protein